MAPIERAARALAIEQSGVDEWDALDEAFQERLKEQARAVLQGIREPSEGMCQAARKAHYLFGIDRAEDDAIGWTFEAMIDAALSE